MSNNVIDFEAVKKSKAAKPSGAEAEMTQSPGPLNQVHQVDPSEQDLAYHARILGMNKLELLEEMVRFQELRSATGELSPEMMKRGRLLFKALEENAETEELRILARSYRRHLDFELAELKKHSR